MPLRVANKHHGPVPAGERAIVIMRPHPLSNAWSHLPGTRARHHVATRDEAVACYRRWLWQEMQRGGAVLAELRQIESLARTEAVTLVCCCAPKACHGDVIVAAVAWLADHPSYAGGPARAASPRRGG